MGIYPSFNDFMLRGLAEHHRTHHATEWFHLRQLRGSANDRQLDALRAMLGEFGLLRCLKADTGPKFLLKKVDDLRPDKVVTAECIYKFSDQPVIMAGGKKSFLSGSSKVLWFTHGHKYPMIDTWTKRGLRTTNKGFFEKLTKDLSYEKAHSATKTHFEQCGKLRSWFSAARFWDKGLFLLGLELEKKWYPFVSDKVLYDYLKRNQLLEVEELIEDLTRQKALGPLNAHFDKLIQQTPQTART